MGNSGSWETFFLQMENHLNGDRPITFNQKKLSALIGWYTTVASIERILPLVRGNRVSAIYLDNNRSHSFNSGYINTVGRQPTFSSYVRDRNPNLEISKVLLKS